MNRRKFLIGSTALVASTLVAAPVLPSAEPTIIGIDFAGGPDISGWWGYTAHGDFYYGPFDTREEAIAQAMSEVDEGEGFQTAWCIPRTVSAPDLAEDIINWLGDDGHWRSDFANMLIEQMVGSNEDADYDGELSDAFHSADATALVEGAQASLERAFLRLGRIDLIAALIDDEHEGAVCDEELVWNALEADTIFASELTALAEAWIDAQGLRDAGRALDIAKPETHVADERSAA